MAITNPVWQQIKNITAKEIVRALKRDGWIQERTRGATIGFTKEKNDAPGYNRIVVHFHPGKTYGPTLLKKLLAETGWNESDLIRLKLIKKQKGRKKSF